MQVCVSGVQHKNATGVKVIAFNPFSRRLY